jgi:hypothetical protein
MDREIDPASAEIQVTSDPTVADTKPEPAHLIGPVNHHRSNVPGTDVCATAVEHHTTARGRGQSRLRKPTSRTERQGNLLGQTLLTAASILHEHYAARIIRGGNRRTVLAGVDRG